MLTMNFHNLASVAVGAPFEYLDRTGTPFYTSTLVLTDTEGKTVEIGLFGSTPDSVKAKSGLI